MEEALEIWVDGSRFAVTQRLPGEDLDLATGLCLTAGVVDRVEDLGSVTHCSRPGGEHRVLVTCTARRATGEARPAPPEVERRLQLTPAALLQCRDQLVAAQPVFAETGATHAAALFDGDCRSLAFAEDVGRHNALDKAIGALARAGRLPEARFAVLSSRLSLEIAQKAAAVGLELLAGVSAATSSAVRLAEGCGMTLVGFLRPGSMNIYAHPARVLGVSDADRTVPRTQSSPGSW